jgi:hypothetical protein
MEAVGAEQQAVAGLQGHGEDVDLDVLTLPRAKVALCREGRHPAEGAGSWASRARMRAIESAA